MKRKLIFLSSYTSRLTLHEFFFRQYPNLILWAPFAGGAGMATYFALSFEPNIYAPFLVAIICTGLIIGIRYSGTLFGRSSNPVSDYRIRTPVTALLLFAFGFFYAAGYTRQVGTNIIPRDIHGAIVSGTVTGLDYTSDRVRIFIDTESIASVYWSGAPMTKAHRVRLSVDPNRHEIPNLGDNVVVNGGLFRPGAASIPGGFDFAEWAYFNRISATGFAEKIEITKHAQNMNTISDIRENIRSNIAGHASPRAAMLSDALILGYKRVLPADESESVKAAGIAHVFSISGFHLTLIGGWIFAFFYFMARAITPLSRRFPARNLAIVPTVMSLTFYLMLSGAAVATQRALLMALVAFLAMIFARNIFSLRTAAIVFGALLLTNPHYIVQAGFQLSFSAVFGIVWYFQTRKYSRKTRLQKVYDALKILFMTSVVATIFTTPYIAYHFHYVPIYTLIGNLLCLPLFSFAIMPLVLIGTITSQFGLLFPLEWAAYVYAIVLSITDWIQALPYASAQMPAMPGIALSLFTLSLMCWIFIIDNKVKISRFAAVFLAVVALVVVAARPRPIFYSSHDNRLVAFMRDDGTLQFNRGSSSSHRMIFDSWEKLNWTRPPETRRPIRRGFDGEKFRATCENRVCIYETPYWKLAYIHQFVPLALNIEKLCNSDVDFIVTPWRIRAPNCDEQVLSGGLVIYKDGRVHQIPTNRIWHR
ncbi:MAG: ComEC family competence protein [Alphaproteobacteria bacterium]|nr:ComEC family competence protein [Alphaproteobacteria bacterium]MCL2757896.1 ComEC family competence protein [Alphaproteobacteria bacterium]